MKQLTCMWCGSPIPDTHTDNQCDSCWEFTRRLDKFVNLSEAALNLVKDAVARATPPKTTQREV